MLTHGSDHENHLLGAAIAKLSSSGWHSLEKDMKEIVSETILGHLPQQFILQSTISICLLKSKSQKPKFNFYYENLKDSEILSSKAKNEAKEKNSDRKAMILIEAEAGVEVQGQGHAQGQGQEQNLETSLPEELHAETPCNEPTQNNISLEPINLESAFSIDRLFPEHKPEVNSQQPQINNLQPNLSLFNNNPNITVSQVKNQTPGGNNNLKDLLNNLARAREQQQKCAQEVAQDQSKSQLSTSLTSQINNQPNPNIIQQIQVTQNNQASLNIAQNSEMSVNEPNNNLSNDFSEIFKNLSKSLAQSSQQANLSETHFNDQPGPSVSQQVTQSNCTKDFDSSDLLMRTLNGLKTSTNNEIKQELPSNEFLIPKTSVPKAVCPPVSAVSAAPPAPTLNLENLITNYLPSIGPLSDPPGLNGFSNLVQNGLPTMANFQRKSSVPDQNQSTVIKNEGQDEPNKPNSHMNNSIASVLDITNSSGATNGTTSAAATVNRTSSTPGPRPHSNKAERKRFQCRFCDHTSNRKNELEDHERKHQGKMLFQCHMCEYKAKQLVTMKGHYYKVHKAKFNSKQVRQLVPNYAFNPNYCQNTIMIGNGENSLRLDFGFLGK